MKKYIIPCILMSVLAFACETSKNMTSGNNHGNSPTSIDQSQKSDNRVEKSVMNVQGETTPITSPAEQRIIKKKQGNTNTMQMMDAVIPVRDSL